VVYNASNNELVRTNTLVKSAIVQIDATPFRQWYEQHYGINLGKTKTAKADPKKGKDAKKDTKKEGAKKTKKEAPKKEGEAAAATPAAAPAAATPKKTTKKEGEATVVTDNTKRKLAERRKERIPLSQSIVDQFAAGRLYASITSRPGQCGRCDGYILEGEELNFYLRKMQKKKGKAQQ
jgi:small subunit ribosomal protein S8e